jgi:phosphoribosylaminoimidazole synthetase
MPDFYSPGEYDLGGFVVGLVEPKCALPRKDVRAGDALIGIRSSGTHSTGYSLLRKLLPEGTAGDARAKELLEPTRIYAKTLLPLIKKRAFKGLAHITGSGFLNIPRISDKISYEIEMPRADELPPVYKWVREASGIGLAELYSTFNMGLGMVGVVAEKDADKIVKALRRSGETAWRIGRIVRREKGKPSRIRIREGAGEVVLDY